MDVVAAGLAYRQDVRSYAPPLRGVIIRRKNGNLLNRLDARRHNRRTAVEQTVNGDAINLVRIRGHALAGRRNLNLVLGLENAVVRLVLASVIRQRYSASTAGPRRISRDA